MTGDSPMVGLSAPIDLEHLRLTDHIVFPRVVVEQVQDFDGFMRNVVRYRIEAMVLADHLVGDTYTTTAAFEFPATPWQHFKQHHTGSRWLRRLVNRRPVRTTTHRQPVTVLFTRYATYPQARIDLDDTLGRPVIYENVEDQL